MLDAVLMQDVVGIMDVAENEVVVEIMIDKRLTTSIFLIN